MFTDQPESTQANVNAGRGREQRAAGTSEQHIDHVLHPRTAVEQLHAIFDGTEHADDGRIAALAKQLLAERDQLAEQLRGAQACQTQAEDYARAYIDAFERLHLRVVGTCDLDAAEAPAPSEQFWADQIERLLQDAKQLYDAIDPMIGTRPESTPHLVVVTHLDPGFDHNDRRPFEYVIGNDVVGWTSHLVTHSAICHLLAYGEQCWFDDEWHHGQFDYGATPPGLYRVLHGQQDVGDHHGEYSHTEDFLDYQRIGNAPTPAADTTPTHSHAGYSEEAPF